MTKQAKKPEKAILHICRPGESKNTYLPWPLIYLTFSDIRENKEAVCLSTSICLEFG